MADTADERVDPESELTWDDAQGAIDGGLQVGLEALHSEGPAVDESAAEAAAQRLARIAQDHAHIEMLRAEGFAGPKYVLFKTALALYGYPVMRAWIRRGQIWSLTAKRGRRVRCPDAVREHLAHDIDDRQELAGETVARALVFFREHALEGAKWTPEGGANITTFFAGACVAVFPNIFRAWLREHEMDQGCDSLDLDAIDQIVDTVTGTDPEDRACLVDLFETALKAAPTNRVRRALARLVLDDAQYAEIAESEGTSEEAIKQMIRRFRRQERGTRRE